MILWIGEDELKTGQLNLKVNLSLYRFSTKERNTRLPSRILEMQFYLLFPNSERTSKREKLNSMNPRITKRVKRVKTKKRLQKRRRNDFAHCR